MRNKPVETAWLIESASSLYVGEETAGKMPHLALVAGHDAALRFARKEDAEALLRMFPFYGIQIHTARLTVTEHEWVNADG